MPPLFLAAAASACCSYIQQAMIRSIATCSIAEGYHRETPCSHFACRLPRPFRGGLTLSNAANAYTGITLINAGTLSVSTLANGGIASGIGASGNAAANLVLANGTLQFTGATVSTDRNFTLATGTTGTFDVALVATNVTISGAAAATTGSLAKTGAGTLTLGNVANAYSGITRIDAGTLSVNTLANGGVVSGIGASSNAAANLILADGTLQYSGATISTDRSFTINSIQTGTFDVSNVATTLTILGNAANTTGALTKTGAGTLELAGNNLFTGTTTINQGTLRVTGSIASNTVIVNTQASFNARFEKQVALTGAYAGINTFSNTVNVTMAQLLSGQNSTGGTEQVSMRWRTAGAGEPNISDVLELSGMTGGFAEADRTDLFVLEMNYKPALLSNELTEAEWASRGFLYIGWRDPNGLPGELWVNAVDGNYGGTSLFAGLGAWSDLQGDGNLANDLGRWGVDINSNTVWAVVNHNSEFVAVPEPSTYLLLGLAVVFLARRRRASGTCP